MTEESDRTMGPFERLVNRILRRVDYYAKYPARVIGQAVNGTLELRPDDPRIPMDVQIPIRLGIPGVKVKVPAGARCAIEYENGDPKKPVATSWEPDAIDEISFDNGTHKVARVDDTVNAGYLTVTTATGGIAGYFPGTIAGLALANAAVAASSGSLALISLTDGRVTSGANKVKA